MFSPYSPSQPNYKVIAQTINGCLPRPWIIDKFEMLRAEASCGNIWRGLLVNTKTNMCYCISIIPDENLPLDVQIKGFINIMQPTIHKDCNPFPKSVR